MYKMIIADDERATRDELAFYEWCKLGIEVIGVCKNGKDALDIITEFGADILLTDIRMPMMNGLELVKRAREINPDLICIILSGYDEFDYLHTSLRLKVFDYLLKPIDFEALGTTFGHVIATLNQQRRLQQEDIATSNRLKKGITQLRRDFFRNLFTTEMTESQILERSVISETDISSKCFSISFLQFDNEVIEKLLKDTENWDLIISGLRRHIDLFFVENPIGYPWIDSKSGNVYIFFNSTNNEVKYIKEIFKLLFKHIKSYSDCLGEGISFALCYNITKLYKINDYVKKLKSMLQYSSEIIISAEELSKAIEKDILVPSGVITEHQRVNINRILKYISENYMNSITLNDVAESVYMNAVYISQLFKKSMGMNFVEYLMRLRIDKAKELLLNPSLTIYQVGIQVGYPNAAYFCQVFKKIEKLSPIEYRNKNINN